MDPFVLLNVSPDADDNQIREAYFRCLRLCPPDRDREGFLKLRQAYDAVRTEDGRIAARLGWHTPVPTLADLAETPTTTRNRATPRHWLDVIATAKRSSNP